MAHNTQVAPLPAVSGERRPLLDRPSEGHRLLIGPLYQSREEAETALKEWARLGGFAVAIARSTNYKDGQPGRIDFRCAKGQLREAIQRNRDTFTKQAGCTWTASVSCLRRNQGRWSVDIPATSHHIDHEAYLTESQLPARQRFTEEMKEVAITMMTNPATKPRDIRAALQRQFPNAVLAPKDIDNLIQKHRRKALDGHTALQYVLTKLQDERVYHKAKFDSSNQPLALFFTFPWQLTIWRQHYHVLSFDCTYRTNQYNMPGLFEGTCLTNTKLVVPVFFGFVTGEKSESYEWLVSCVEEARRAHDIHEPNVLFTDLDDNLKAALGSQLPHVPQQLCITHVNADVALNVKQKWSSAQNTPADELSPAEVAFGDIAEDEDRNDSDLLGLFASFADDTTTATELVIPFTCQGLLDLWKLLVCSPTEEEFLQLWQRLQDDFADKPAAVAYLRSTYWPLREQWAACYTDKLRNFGLKTMSPTKSAHKELKSFLVGGTCDFQKLYDGIKLLLGLKEKTVSETLFTQKERLRRQYLNRPWLLKTAYYVTYSCVDILVREYRKTLGSAPPEPCTNTFRQQYGMPCSHEIRQLVQQNKHVTKDEIDSFWWLEEDLYKTFPFLLIQDPVVAARGRPRNTVDSDVSLYSSQQPLAQTHPALSAPVSVSVTQPNSQPASSRSTVLAASHRTASQKRQLSAVDYGGSLQEMDAHDARRQRREVVDLTND